MITKQSKVLYLDNVNLQTGTLSILKREYTLDDGLITDHQDIRRAFVPGQLDAVKQFLGVDESPEIAYLESLWTPDVIAAYQQQLASQE